MMWLILAVSALGVELCPSGVQLAAGPDLFNLWTSRRGLVVEPLSPGWSGGGWNQQVIGTVRAIPCARIGAQVGIVLPALTDSVEDPGIDSQMWQVLSHAMVGAEWSLPYRFSAGLYALPGLRTAIVASQVSVPEFGIDETSIRPSVVPVLYGAGVVRWFASKSFGIHLDIQVPISAFQREIGSYPIRFVGAGIDLRLPTRDK